MEQNNRSINKEGIKQAIRALLEAIGENPDREGLKETPARVAKFYQEWLLQEYKPTGFESSYDEMVIIKDVRFYSLCEHHLLPFHGTAKIGYIPSGKVLGLSKIVRILKKHSSKPQIQERLTEEVAAELQAMTDAAGVMVVLEAEHLCMSMRGVQTPGKTVTSCIKGAFEKAEARQEFLELTR